MATFQVFVKLDLNGQGTITIDGCQPNTTIKEFKQKICAREPLAEEIRLIYGGKQLSKENATLSDYNVQKESTLFAVFRLLGGAMPAKPVAVAGKTYSFDVDKVKALKQMKIGQSMVPLKVEKEKGGCILNYCPDAVAVSFEGHGDVKVCGNCMASWVRTKIYNGKSSIPCVCSCREDLAMDAAFTMCGLSDQEWKDWEFWLNKNALGFKVCPNAQCQKFVMRDRKELRVRCPSCKSHDFCWLCLGSWKGGGSQQCGNTNCTAAAEALVALQDAWDKRAQHGKQIGNNKNFPLVRICPNTMCSRLNEWTDNCKHMTCAGCTHQYCHVCLKKWKNCKCGYCEFIGDSAPLCTGSLNSGYYQKCEVAEQQKDW